MRILSLSPLTSFGDISLEASTTPVISLDVDSKK